ncbi:histidine phosphatase family protein [Roseiconus nitratireducens]|uniref:Histidine phosphatase family protein n=1 Tax=Roseiconus nitratireducens TaxID=2605748 RepID=A0A5M6CXX3_9BACT|nr:histidine phosphatase family protein [Roseiconus nitratireducens]KAA5540067.1 histidine phosphatase family protein [Roseiconus nitratireducens]
MRTATLTNVLLVRPGATEFDEQGRMKGSLDMPLSDRGEAQAEHLAKELSGVEVKAIFSSPCESARETARRLARQQHLAGRDVKVKVIDALRNIDHGLWHGKLIDEVRRNHPRFYRQGEDFPEAFCPPGGEPVGDAKARVGKALRKCVKRAREGVIAMVIPDPMATVVESILSGDELKSVWDSETDSASWSMIETELG